MKRSEIAFGVLRIPVDFLMAVLGFFLAYMVRSQTDLIPGVALPTTMPLLEEFLPFVLLASLGLILLFAINGMYSLKSTSKLRKEFWKILYIATVWIGCIVGVYFLMRSFFPSRLLLIYGWALTVVLLVGGRLLIRGVQRCFLQRGIGTHRVIIIGTGVAGTAVANAYKNAPAYRVTDIIGADNDSFEKLEKLCASKDVDIIIQTMPLPTQMLTLLTEMCYEHHVRFRFVPEILDTKWLSLESSDELGLPLMEVKPSPLDGWGRVWKRTMDIMGAIAAIILLSPFMISTAIAVWIQMHSFREIIFRQKRYGQWGKLFWFYKFQSMYVGAVNEHKKLMEQQQGERKGLLKIQNDPRVTPVGRFIRKTSLDELAQLWNILKGDMSIIGPRPHMPAEVDEVKKKYSPILHMKPGITGLPQVSGRSRLSFDEEMQLDMYYLEHWSLWMDISILFRTVWVVLLRKDAS